MVAHQIGLNRLADLFSKPVYQDFAQDIVALSRPFIDLGQKATGILLPVKHDRRPNDRCRK